MDDFGKLKDWMQRRVWAIEHIKWMLETQHKIKDKETLKSELVYWVGLKKQLEKEIAEMNSYPHLSPLKEQA